MGQSLYYHQRVADCIEAEDINIGVDKFVDCG